MRDQPDADESVNKIERQKVGGSIGVFIADVRGKPNAGRFAVCWLLTLIGDGIGAGGDPEQRYDGEQHCPRERATGRATEATVHNGVASATGRLPV
jgi:hypothetical protein